MVLGDWKNGEGEKDGGRWYGGGLADLAVLR
jgi:hypothetical protein